MNYPALLRQLFDKKPFNQKDIIRAVGHIKPDSLAKSLKELREKVSDEDKLFMAQVIVGSLRNQLPNSNPNERVDALKSKEIGQIYEILFEQVIVHFSTIKWSQENKNDNSLTNESEREEQMEYMNCLKSILNIFRLKH